MSLVIMAALLLFRRPVSRQRAAAVRLRRSVSDDVRWARALFISTISRTQQQAMMTTFLFFQPFFLLSGFAFPIRNMPIPSNT